MHVTPLSGVIDSTPIDSSELFESYDGLNSCPDPPSERRTPNSPPHNLLNAVGVSAKIRDYPRNRSSLDVVGRWRHRRLRAPSDLHRATHLPTNAPQPAPTIAR